VLGENPAVTTVRLLLVPYDSEHRAARMGAGPLRPYDRDDRMRDTALDLLGDLGRRLPTH
jgi:hypothetical protein